MKRTVGIVFYDRREKKLLLCSHGGGEIPQLGIFGGDMREGESLEEAIAKRVAESLIVTSSPEYDPYVVKNPLLLTTLQREETVEVLFCSPLDAIQGKIIARSGDDLIWAGRTFIEGSITPNPDREVLLQFFDSPLMLTNRELVAKLIEEAFQAGPHRFQDHQYCELCREQAKHQSRVEVYQQVLMRRLTVCGCAD